MLKGATLDARRVTAGFKPPKSAEVKFPSQVAANSFPEGGTQPSVKLWHETYSSAGTTQPSPAVPGSNGVCGPSLPGTGMAFAGAPVSARWRSRCAERGLRQADCVAARPAAECWRLQSSSCCGPTIPQVWPGLSSGDLKAQGRMAFMASGGAASIFIPSAPRH